MASSDLGKLCRKSSGPLAYKKGGSALIYKAAGRQTCTIKVQFGVQSWVCNTYSCYHEIQYSATGSFTSGSGTIESSYSVMDCAEFKVKAKGSSASVFTVYVTAKTSCGALDKESPGATCTAVAAQPGATPRSKANTSCTPNTAVSIKVSFDANGKLTGIS